MTVLALNAGSSSIKLALFDLESRELWRASVSGIGSGATLLRTRDPGLAPSGADAGARVAVDYYCYQVRRQIGAPAAAMEGIDRIVFTGGIGANAPVIRTAICAGLGYLGVELSASANASSARTVSSTASGIQVNVVQTDEEAVIARKALAHREGGEARASGAPN